MDESIKAVVVGILELAVPYAYTKRQALDNGG
jgi:hypothetical protein